MFVKLKNVENVEVKVNTSQIAFISGATAFMSNGAEVILDSQSLAQLESDLFGDLSVSNPRASAHTANLLNELHKLLGGRGEAKPTTDRKARLKSRLKDFSEDELKTAAQNLGSDEFMQGANDNNKRYGTIDYLLRTSANVNKWLEEQPQKKKGMF